MELNEEGHILWLSLVAAVEKALGGHPPDAAQLTVNTPDLSIAIHPRREGAADIELGFNGIDEVYLEVGLTDACLWQVNATPLDETIYRIVAAVAAGKLEEAGKASTLRLAYRRPRASCGSGLPSSFRSPGVGAGAAPTRPTPEAAVRATGT